MSFYSIVSKDTTYDVRKERFSRCSGRFFFPPPTFIYAVSEQNLSTTNCFFILRLRRMNPSKVGKLLLCCFEKKKSFFMEISCRGTNGQGRWYTCVFLPFKSSFMSIILLLCIIHENYCSPLRWLITWDVKAHVYMCNLFFCSLLRWHVNIKAIACWVEIGSTYAIWCSACLLEQKGVNFHFKALIKERWRG